MKHGLAKAWNEHDLLETESREGVARLHASVVAALGPGWVAGAHESFTLFREGMPAADPTALAQWAAEGMRGSAPWLKVRTCLHGYSPCVLVSYCSGDPRVPVGTVRRGGGGGSWTEARIIMS